MTAIATVTRIVMVAMVYNTSSTKIGQCGMTDDRIVYRAEPSDPAFIYLESWCIDICDYCPHKWKVKVGDTMHGAARIIRITGLEIPAPRKPPMITGLAAQEPSTRPGPILNYGGGIVDIKIPEDDERL
jgi:hypothetical protein